MTNGPLSGVRVFDLTVAEVGPWASLNLGALGADVIHVEPTPTARGNDARVFARGGVLGERPMATDKGIQSWAVGYIAWNMNKRGITLDLKAAEDIAYAHELLKTCDVFLMNMRPDVAARLGVDYDAVAQINPGIVYCTVTGWGHTGPMRELPGADGQVQYFTGGADANGAEGAPGEIYRHSTQFDSTSGNYACMSILMALVGRKKTGKGQRVDISMLKATTAMQTPRIAEYLMTKQGPTRLGNKAQSTAPDRAFATADKRELGVSATSEEEWQALCKAIGHLEFTEDPRFATNTDRVDHRDELYAALDPIFASMPLDYWVLELNKVGVPNGRMMRWDEIRHHDQVTENNYIGPVDTKQWGRVWTSKGPWHFSSTPTRWFATPGIGEHNDEILKEIEASRAAAGSSTGAPAGREQ